MSKICAKCEKPVYPLEELKCLDKIWHKVCFKCTECGMALNMKNYKGFNKFPYCSAHYPQTKHTVVADTPEMQRLSQTSKIQSQNLYQNEFKKSLGKYTQIADDQEMQRLKRNQENFSMAKYHEEFEKKIKGSKIQIADDPETQRLKQLSSVVSQVEYKGLREKMGDMEAKRKNTDNRQSIKSVDEDQDQASPHTDRNQSHSVAYTGHGKADVNPSSKKIGSISNYDPASQSSNHRPLSKQTQEWEETVPIGSGRGTRLQANNTTAKQGKQNSSSQFNQNSSSQNDSSQSRASSRSGKKSLGVVCKAVYDYTAQDSDEVTFKEDDIIINCDPIDEGWMYGTVQRTGLRGMLPSNYVEKVQ